MAKLLADAGALAAGATGTGAAGEVEAELRPERTADALRRQTLNCPARPIEAPVTFAASGRRDATVAARSATSPAMPLAVAARSRSSSAVVVRVELWLAVVMGFILR